MIQPGSSHDLLWMSRALAEARRGLGRVEPNPMVGSVVVREGRIVSVGHHEVFGGPHAEVLALQRAGADARGASLYVTLEPCCHTGKTPPCVDAILRAGISRVVAAMRDPFPKVAGGGFSRLEEAGVKVEVGLEEASARALNAAYLKRLMTARPYVTAKWAMTLDGKTAVKGGQSQWISGARSRAMVHELRGRVDGILVGVGTALQDDPLLTARPEGPRKASRVVLDSAARLPRESRLVRTAGDVPVVVASTRRAEAGRVEALRQAGCEVMVFETEGPVPVGPLLDELGARGWTNLLVEGGGRVLGSFLDAGEVDEVEVYIAPVVEGGDHARTAIRGQGVDSMSRALRLVEPEIQVLDGDVRLRGVLAKPWREAPPPA